jgi:2-polyprenyl-6-hydroxyphenyl methylase/3-demethylubiquinone-9 3-methyltransferase
VSWHSHIAGEFSAAYEKKTRFSERLGVWSSEMVTWLNPGSVVADLGCGPGHLAIIAASVAQSVIAVDGSEEMLEIARKAAAYANVNNIQFLRERLEHLTVQNVDAILCSSVLEYMQEPWSFLRKCAEILPSGGLIMFSLPNGGSVYRKLEATVFRLTGRPRYRRFVTTVPTVSSVQSQLVDAGLDIRAIRFYGRVAGLSLACDLLGGPELATTMTLFVATKRAARSR